jgi:hypothetical protein
MARTSSNPGATAAAGPTVPKIKPGAPIEGVEETAASPGLQAELMGEVKADTLPGATAATGPTIAKIKPGAPIEEVEETAASPGLQAELVGEAKADTPVGGRINPSQPIAPGVHRIKSGSLVEDADEVPPPPAR